MAGSSINKSGIRELQQELQREFDKNPIRIPIEVESPAYSPFPPAGTVNNYHGPVVTVTGDYAQVAWSGSGDVDQTQKCASSTVALGYEELAELMTQVLANLGAFQLPEDDAEELATTAQTVLAEVVETEPDRGKIKRAVTMIKGLLAPIVSGISAGVNEGLAEQTAQMIEALGSALPS